MATTRLGQFGIGLTGYGVFQPKGAAPEPEPEPEPVGQSVHSTGGGGGGLGWFRTKKGKRRYNEFFDDIVDEVKREMEMERARRELEEMFARKGQVARKALEAALEVMRVQRKKRRRRAAAIMLLDS